MPFIRTLAFYTYYTLITAILGVFIGLTYPFVPNKYLKPVADCWNILVIHGARWLCGIRYQQIGEVPKTEKAYVILSKHQSAWETFYLQTVFNPVSTILKKELLKIPGFGWGLRVLEPVAINRSNPLNAIKQVKKLGMTRIKSGRNLLVFPEGTRMPLGVNGKYARSGAEIAIATGVDIIPVAHNAGHCWLNKSFLKRSGLVTVVIGEPISTQEKTSKQVIIEVQAWIEAQQALIDPPKDKPVN